MRLIRLRQDWMVRAKMLTLLHLAKRNFNEEGDVELAREVMKDVHALIDNPILRISDTCRIQAREDVALVELLIISL
jgi:uncharacterized protein HemX